MSSKMKVWFLKYTLANEKLLQIWIIWEVVYLVEISISSHVSFLCIEEGGWKGIRPLSHFQAAGGKTKGKLLKGLPN